MPELGKKYECFNCRTKFYNLGRPEAICPKCGANQKNAKADEAPAPAPRPPRRSALLMEPIPEETTNEFGEEPPVAEDDEASDDEFDEDEEAAEKEKEKEEEEEF